MRSSVRLWLSRLRQVAYDMDDLLDRRLKSAVDKTDGGGRRDDDDRKKVWCLSSPYACFERTVSNLKDAREMKEIRERLDQIAGERNRFNFSNSRGDEMLVGRGDRSWTTFLRRESEMVGMEDEKREIISRLLSGSGDDYGNVDVFAIVGLAGMGKTTLAREIYHDISVRDHFDFFSWVCVSEIFDLVSVTKAIIRYHLPRGTTPADLGLDSLQAELGEMLRGKKFLLILDDVWNEDREKWALLRQPLKSAAPGSKILVTARAKLVANVMNPVYIHELNGLSDDQAWRLFSLMAFHGWSLEDISELETVGREIVKKCKGVPLSIKVMAHEMNFRRTVADWHSVLDSGMMSSPRVADKNLPPFLRSYYNLPPHLKQCFIYCSLFPKGAVLVKAKLVKLWIAQDFIRREGNREIEHIGTEYFDDLVERSMIQEVGIYGKENRFQMHDLLHDLAEFIAEGDTYIFMSGKSEHFPVNVRHASVFFIADNTSIRIDSHSARKLRTLFVHRIDKIGTALASGGGGCEIGGLQQLNSLQGNLQIQHLERVSSPEEAGRAELHNKADLQRLVLEMSGGDEDIAMPGRDGKISRMDSVFEGLRPHPNIMELCHELKALPDGLEQLESLKQLTVEHCNKLESLPDGLGQLQSLEQLTIEYCNKLKSIPAGLGQLRAVRALKINHLGALTCLPDGLVQLMAVKSLKINNFESLTCLPNGLGQLHSLEELIIEDCHNLERLVDELVQLEALKSLEINGLDALIYLPNGLGQLQSLKELRIEGCNKLESLPESMGQLQSLEELMIKDCNKLKSIPDALGQLKALKSLTIAGLNALTSLPDGLGELIALKTFIIHHLHALTRLPDGLGQLQSLETLRISSCQKVESLPNGLGQLRKLKLLDISRLEAVTGLPDALEQLESLETLRICYWEKLESLPPWLEQLRGLKEVEEEMKEKIGPSYLTFATSALTIKDSTWTIKGSNVKGTSFRFKSGFSVLDSNQLFYDVWETWNMVFTLKACGFISPCKYM
ncbi:hypothetical protein ACLOJK_019752 [Asimina triloba]